MIFGVKQPDRLPHTYIIGKIDTGKSTLLSNLVQQDLWHGHGLCLIDPHGDLVEQIYKHVPAHRNNDVLCFNVPERLADCPDTHPLALLHHSHGLASARMTQRLDDFEDNRFAQGLI